MVTTSEVKFVATDKMRKRCTTLPQERVTSFNRHPPLSNSLQDESEVPMGVENEGLAEQKDGENGAKRPGASDSAPSKRARVGPPDGFVKVPNPWCWKLPFPRCRTMCVAHMRRHYQTYAGY